MRGGIRMSTKNSETEKFFDIVAGPNKDRLFDACKYAYDNTTQIPIHFTVANGYTAPKGNPGCAYAVMFIKDVVISSIEHEDGSGENFNLCGYCNVDSVFIKDTPTHTSFRFRAYYNTRTRSGYIALSNQ